MHMGSLAKLLLVPSMNADLTFDGHTLLVGETTLVRARFAMRFAKGSDEIVLGCVSRE